MRRAIVTGSGGLVGSAAVRRLCAAGFDVIGVDNDARASFFGPEASTRPVSEALAAELDAFRWAEVDVRDADGVDRLFRDAAPELELVVHAAAQPSHDWAASDPLTDFTINANGTLNLLEAHRAHAPDATFAHLSTNKVYGDTPNRLPLRELETRFDLPEDHHWFGGIDTTMSIDRSTHSPFGVSKTAADLLVQEHGRYHGLPTVCLRAGCVTGPAHAGAELHGFLAYLMRCTVTGRPYTIYGHGGKQVRDNIHAADVATAIEAFHASPRPAAVYNIGGGREASCSVIEAISISERIAGRELEVDPGGAARVGDHIWWISDLGELRSDFPDWAPSHGVEEILAEIHELNAERWLAAV